MSLNPSKRGARVKPGDKRSARVRALAMCDHVSAGKSLRAAAEIEGFDSSHFLRLVANDEPVRILYEASRIAGIEARVASLDEEAQAAMKVALSRGSKASAYAALFGRKVAITLWEAERLMPKKYGNRLDLNHSGSIDIASRLNAARQRTKE